MTIELTEEECTAARDYVLESIRINKTRGSYQPLQASDLEFQRMIAGRKGEIAFSKLVGIPPPHGIDVDLYDFMIPYRGKMISVDVKTSLYPGADLTVVIGKKEKWEKTGYCDLYILGIMRSKTEIEFVGEATGNEVFNEKNIEKPNGRDRFFRIRRKDLPPVTVFDPWFPDPDN